MNPVALLEYIETAMDDGFRTARLPGCSPIEGVHVVGCVQKRTMALHRAVCIIALDASIVDPEAALKKARRYLHKALKARFWRGLGLGVVVYSKVPLFAKSLFNMVDTTAENTTILQWVANVSPVVQTLTAAHIWTQISTPHLLDFIDGYAKLNESY